MTPHNDAKKEDIAKIVLMPGDPLRAKYIADNFLENARLVNSVRNMYGYTGKYKGKEITVFASGMGMPSMGIYCFELYKFYDVETIIRIGSCGGYSKDLNLFDTVLLDNTYTEGNFAFSFDGGDSHIAKADKTINSIIEETAKDKSINCKTVNGTCTECFDYYVQNLDTLINRFPKELNIQVAEMEAFALFYIAEKLNKKAACLLTVVDNHYKPEKEATSEERQNSLNEMITLSLETILKMK